MPNRRTLVARKGAKKDKFVVLLDTLLAKDNGGKNRREERKGTA